MSLLELARPAVRALKPYVSARSLTLEGRVFLDANEAPESGLPDIPGLNRYPEPQPGKLLALLAQRHGVGREKIVIGRGSDEAIDLLVRAFCEAGRDSILITPPTYGVYEIAAAIQGAKVARVPLLHGDGWRLDEAGISRELDNNQYIKLIFLCSPNNPTGTGFDPEVIARIARSAGERALVVVDEAYAEFSRRQSLLERLDSLPNLIVLRTLSKAWAAAGVRCGVAIGAPELIDLLQRIRAPYPLSAPQIERIEQALSPESELRLRERVARVRAERARMAASLLELESVRRVDPSEANFLLIEVAHRERLLQATRARGIILRDRHGEPGLDDCVRITIGTQRENDELLQLLRAIDRGPTRDELAR